VNTIAPGTPLPTYDRGNRLLDALGTLEREAIAAQVFVIELVSGAVTHEYGALDTWVYFPIDCVLSVVATLEDGQGCEVGTIGNEGASGIPIALGARVLRTTICQVAGRIGRLSMLSLADRKESDTYELTHEYLSFMLGVRRPSVTLAERRLRELGAIEYRYGVIRILDRALLESLACECYRTAAENFQFSIDTSREIHDSNGRLLLLRSSAHGT
jgi:hypothetical protein